MIRTKFSALAAVVFATLIGASLVATRATHAQTSDRVFEMRTYTCNEGKLPDLLKRFREHTTKLFEKHGMKNIAYWVPTDEPQKSNTLIYVIAHPSREAATANWKAFGEDPEWQSVQKASEANGKIVEKVDSTFMELTDFSPTPR